jgi:hypothetical protein
MKKASYFTFPRVVDVHAFRQRIHRFL